MTNPALSFGAPGMHYATTGAMAGACVTDDERALANNACARTVMRGVGQFTTTQQALGWYYDEDTRWRDVDPCVVTQLPSCPCVSQDDVEPMMGCFAGGPPQGWSADYHNQWCAQRGAGMRHNAWCPGVPPPPVPDCLTPQHRGVVDYCTDRGYGGGNPFLNGLCWAAIRGGSIAALQSTPNCVADVPPPYVPPPPPNGDQYVFVPPNGDEEEEPTGNGETERAGMILPGLILLLVLGGATAYYVAQRKGG